MEFFQEYIGFILSVLGGLASLIIILRLLLAPLYTRMGHIENQVDNHIPTQIRELDQRFTAQIREFDQKFTTQIRELREDIKALNQKTDQKIDQINQRLDQTNQRLDRLFEMLSKDRQNK